MKTITTLIISLTAIITLAAGSALGSYSGGTGEPNNPYLISTPADMNQIGRNYTDWDKCFKLTADINLSAYTGAQFSRIGTDFSHVFSGVFDGNEHTISGFTYTLASSDIGIFGNISAAGIVKNVSLVDVNVTGRSYVGGLAGYDGGTISNCNSTGTVSGSSGSYYVGGLVGANGGGSISNCYSTGSVSGSSWVGGLVGENVGSVVGSFWDINTSGLTTSAGGTGMTTAQMKALLTFTSVGWDFTTIWAICEGASYPKLAWQFIPGDFNNDKKVDFVDFTRMGLKWRRTDSTLYCGGTDLTGDGMVNLADFAIFAGHWLEGVEP